MGSFCKTKFIGFIHFKPTTSQTVTSVQSLWRLQLKSPWPYLEKFSQLCPLFAAICDLVIIREISRKANCVLRISIFPYKMASYSGRVSPQHYARVFLLSLGQPVFI